MLLEASDDGVDRLANVDSGRTFCDGNDGINTLTKAFNILVGVEVVDGLGGEGRGVCVPKV